MRTPSCCVALTLALVLAPALAAGQAQSKTATDGIGEVIVKSAGIDRGLCLVIDETDGTLSAGLAKASRFYVQGCAREEKSVASAGQALAAAGVARRASVILREVDFLPYADNLVNLVVCADFKASGVSAEEVLRVLTPGGVAVLGNAGDIEALLNKAGVKDRAALSGGKWIRFTKPIDPDLGTWTHVRGGSDQSYVSDDRAVAPWHEIRWIGDPRWGSLYLSYGSLVTAGGRLYYTECHAAKAGKQWHLVARDAYNGGELWRAMAGPVWQKSYTTTDFTLTCDDDRVYLLEGKNLLGRDGRTGQIVKDYPLPWIPRVVTSAGKTLLASSRLHCVAVDKASGKVLWTRPCVTHPAAAGGGSAYVAAGGTLAGVELASGKELWTTAVKGLPEKLPPTLDVTVMTKAGVVYVVVEERYKPIGQVSAFDAGNGKLLWSRDGKFSHGVLPFEDEVWCLSRDPKDKIDNMSAIILDPRTGHEKRSVTPKGTVMAKCWGGRACANYIMYGNGWFVNRSTAEGLSDPTTRSPCGLGQHPANGLTYFMPHHCDCKITLRGFLALSKPSERRWFDDPNEQGQPRLFPGGGELPTGKDAPGDWPTYRHDIRRSNATAGQLPARPTLLWSQQLGDGPLTQATAAYGMVYTAEPDARRVFARDAASGAAKWVFLADGRVTHPPTLSAGLCLFGTGAGSVYCLDAATGRQIWRLRAAPIQKLIGVESQFDSPWPVTGSVLVMDGTAYFSTGRSNSQSSGLWLFAVEAATGKIKWRVKGAGSGDLFVSDGDVLRHSGYFYTPKSGAAVSRAKQIPGILHCTRYLSPVSVADYMATVEPNLSYKKHIALTDGRILGDCIAFSETASLAGWRNGPIAPGYKDPDKRDKFFLQAAGDATWSLQDIQQHPQGIVLGGDRGYIACRPISYDPADPSEFWVVSIADGKLLQTMRLAGVPVYDGLSAAGGRLYLATTDGRLCCFGPAQGDAP